MSHHQTGYYPPPPNPESGYYDNEAYEDYEVEYEEPASSGSSVMPFVLGCGVGGCTTLLALGLCAIMLMGLWVLDPGSELFAPSYPGDDIGLTLNDPARPSQEVVNEQGIRLNIVDVNRNAQSNTIPQTEGVEIIVLTVELENLSNDEVAYDDERHFNLLNQTDGFYEPTPGAIDGALGIGNLDAGDGTQGRLVFQILADEQGLILEWDMGEPSTPRYIELQ